MIVCLVCQQPLDGFAISERGRCAACGTDAEDMIGVANLMDLALCKVEQHLIPPVQAGITRTIQQNGAIKAINEARAELRKLRRKTIRT